MRGSPVLEEKDALPGPEDELAADDWDDFAGAGQGHAEMAGAVVGSFAGVDEKGQTLGDKVIKKRM